MATESAQDFIEDNRTSSLITFFNSRQDVDIESGGKIKRKLAKPLKNSEAAFLTLIKKMVPFLSRSDSLDDALTSRDSQAERKSYLSDPKSQPYLPDPKSQPYLPDPKSQPYLPDPISIENVTSAPSSVTFRAPSDSVLPHDTRKQFIANFVAKEMVCHAELHESFAKISSHLDILSYLGGGEYLKTYDQDLVEGLLKMSLFFIQSIRIAPRIEWREEFEELRIKFEKFASIMQDYMSAFEKQFPGSSLALERTTFIISGIRDRLEIYQRICLIPATAAYWYLSTELQKVVDVFYKSEKEYRQFLISQPEALEQFQNLGILDTESGKEGLKSTKLLLKISEELAECMIYNPCTYGLIHRKSEISEAFEAHAKYTTIVMERLCDYRDATSRTWHRAEEEISDQELNTLIDAFKRDLAKPIDRLIHFQHILEYFKNDASVDQVQVTFAKYVVDGVLKNYLVQHAYQITPTLTPKWN